MNINIVTTRMTRLRRDKKKVGDYNDRYSLAYFV